MEDKVGGQEGCRGPSPGYVGARGCMHRGSPTRELTVEGHMRWRDSVPPPPTTPSPEAGFWLLGVEVTLMADLTVAQATHSRIVQARGMKPSPSVPWPAGGVGRQLPTGLWPWELGLAASPAPAKGASQAGEVGAGSAQDPGLREQGHLCVRQSQGPQAWLLVLPQLLQDSLSGSRFPRL